MFFVGLDFDIMLTSRLHLRALERSLELLGEAANRVSPSFREAHPEIAFREMIGMRNVLAHEYGLVRLEILWDTARADVPRLLEQLRPLLAEDAT